MKKYALLSIIPALIPVILLNIPAEGSSNKAIFQDASGNSTAETTVSEIVLEKEIPIEQAVEVFQQHQPASLVSFKTDGIVAFMNSYSEIDKQRTKLNYATIRGGGAKDLLRTIQYFRDFPMDQLSKEGQLAYWLNLRNLLVVFAITVNGGNGPVDERGTFDEPGSMWSTKRVVVDGVNLSIDDIERHIILPNWGYNPNILYGFYQGSEDGPPLFKPGFREDNVSDVLGKLGKRYFNGKKIVSVKKDNIETPVVYQWYSETLFEGDDAKLMKHFKRVSKDKLRSKLDKVNTISFVEATYVIDTAGTIRRKKKPQTISLPPPSSGGGVGSAGRSGS